MEPSELAKSPRTAADPRLMLLACILASSVVGMDSLMTTVALPAMADGLDAGIAVQQWIIAAPLIALGSLMLVGGGLGDTFGRWRVFRLGTAGLGAAALVSALAPNPALLITGRFLQGVAAALMLPSVLAVITATLDGQARSKAIATWSAWSGLSVIAGPIVGGVLIDALSWRAVYGLELPLALLVVVLIGRAAPRGPEPGSGHRVDLVGALLSVPAVGGPAFFLIQGPGLGWTAPLPVAALGAGLLALVLFLVWERRTPTPLLPLVLFRIRTFTVLNLVTFVLYGALISCGTYTVLFLQDHADYPPAVAGVAAAVPILVLFLLSSRVGSLADRFGGGPFIVAGSFIAGAGMLLLLRAGPDAGLFSVVLPSVLVHGLGLALLVAPLTSGVMSSVTEDRAGVASGVNNAVARTGSMLAIAVIGAVISLRFSSDLDTAGSPLGPQAQRALDAARDHPLASSPTTPVTPAVRDEVEPILTAASLDAFQTGVVLMGGAAIVASLIGLLGLRRKPEPPPFDAKGTIGCPITGARSHTEAPPPGSRLPARSTDQVSAVKEDGRSPS